MTRVRPGASVMPADGLPDLAALDQSPFISQTEGREIIKSPVLMTVAGPAVFRSEILGDLGVKSCSMMTNPPGWKTGLQTTAFLDQPNGYCRQNPLD